MNRLRPDILVCVLVLAAAGPLRADSQPAEASDQSARPAELSVPPLDHVTYPAQRPEWVAAADGAAPYTKLDESRVVVLSGLCESRQQCRDRLDVAVRVAIDQYILELSDFCQEDLEFQLHQDEIDQLISRRYLGTAEQGGTTMHEGAIELRFHPALQRRIVETARNSEVKRRLYRIGGWGAGGLVALLGSTVVVGSMSRCRDRRCRRSASSA